MSLPLWDYRGFGIYKVKQQSVPNNGFQRHEDVTVQKKIPGMVTGTHICVHAMVWTLYTVGQGN